MSVRIVDVTERKRAEAALQESQAKFRDYAESASDWFWEIGPDYKFTLLTENAFGSNAADRIGTACWDGALDLETDPEKWRLLWAILDSRKPFRDFVYRSIGGNGSPMYVKASGIPGFDPRYGLPSYEAAAQRTHPDDRERVREQARRAVRQKRDYKLEYRILVPTGTIKHIEMNAHPKFSESGELVEVVSTLIDVTERRRAQEEHERLRQLESDLAHMNRLSMMGELAASLAHEITQPIAAARNNARAALNFLDKQAARPRRGQGSARLCRRRCRPRGRHHRPDS